MYVKRGSEKLYRNQTPAAFRKIIKELVGEAVYKKFPLRIERLHREVYVTSIDVQMFNEARLDNLQAVDTLREKFQSAHNAELRFWLHREDDGTGWWEVSIPNISEQGYEIRNQPVGVL